MEEHKLSSEEAKALVWELLPNLDSFCRRQFLGDDALASEAQNYVLEKLQENNWYRARAWQGRGKLRSFFLVVAKRLVGDFRRAKFGHVREPEWLKSKKCGLHNAAYKLLVKCGLSQQATIEELVVNHPTIKRKKIEDVVSLILSRCKRVTGLNSRIEVSEMTAAGSTDPPLLELMIKKEQHDLGKALLCAIVGENGADSGRETRVLSERLLQHIKLKPEDRLFLRLHFVEGVKVQQVARLLRLTGDPYKRRDKLIKVIRKACQSAGVKV